MNDSIVNFGGTAIYVDDVPAALDFYRRAFGMRTRFFDEALQYGDQPALTDTSRQDITRPRPGVHPDRVRRAHD